MNKSSKYFQLLLAITLAIGLFGPASVPTVARTANLHPALAQLAAESPEQVVAVIVQKADSSGAAEKLAVKLGGTVTKNLHIINAFVAEMTASAARELARNDAVHWVSLDAPVEHSGGPIDITKLKSAYVKAVGADRVWNEGPAYLQGQGVTVAVVDSGDCQGTIFGVPCNDVMDSSGTRSRVTMSVTVMRGQAARVGGPDLYGHGSLVEGVIGGNGLGSKGKNMGIAPNVNLVSVKVADDTGQAVSSDVMSGLQWVLDNKDTYNIRVVNLSLNSSIPESYNTSPLNAAVEILWFNGIVVVVSAGNNGTATLYAPANDPFVITVGATDDKGTAALTDDTMATFSAYGTDETGAVKPDLVAPGKNITSILPKPGFIRLKKDHPGNLSGETASNQAYMRVSGTSFSAPIVSGAVALLLQDEPNLTPDQVKYRLMATANKTWPGYNATTAGAGYLDIYAAVIGTTIENANTGLTASQLLWSGSEPVTWGSVNWNSVNWNAVNWNAVNWNAVNWNAVNWNSDYWGP